MCKPGYNWLSMPYSKNGGKCVAGGYGFDRDKSKPGKPDVPAPSPEQPAMPSPDTAVKQEKAARMSTPKAVK